MGDRTTARQPKSVFDHCTVKRAYICFVKSGKATANRFLHILCPANAEEAYVWYTSARYAKVARNIANTEKLNIVRPTQGATQVIFESIVHA